MSQVTSFALKNGAAPLKSSGFLLGPKPTDSMASSRRSVHTDALKSHEQSQLDHTEPEPAAQTQKATDSVHTQNTGTSATVEHVGHTHSSTVEHDGHTHSSTVEHGHTHSAEDHGHSHGLFGHAHTHLQPNELLLTSFDLLLRNPAVRITWIGLLVNIGMAVAKGLGGVYFHSRSLLADAIHSISDTVADVLTLATVNVSGRIGGPTKFPLGYGKIETVGSLLVSGVLLFAGVSVGWSLMLQIFEYTLPTWLYEYAATIQIGHSHSHTASITGSSLGLNVHDHGHSHSHSDSLALLDVESDTGADTGAGAEIPAMSAAWLAAGSIAVKEVLFRKTMQVAAQTNLKVLVANAWHHRVDSMTLMVALVTITGAHVFNWAWLDSVGGLLVSVLIIRTGWSTFASLWNDLVDRGEPADSELYVKVKGIADKEVLAVTEGVFKVLELSVMLLGASSNVYITLKEQKGDHLYNIRQLNALEDRIKDSIHKDDKFIKNIFITFKGQHKE